MKKIIAAVFMVGLFAVFSIASADAHAIDSAPSSDNHTAVEEKEGKMLWDRLQSKQLTCKDLADADFASLGEYFMGTMMGTSHESMNNMMVQMMGEKGEEQMHVVMGKRLSGCDTAAIFPAQANSFMPMMFNMAGQNFLGSGGMMNYGFGAGSFWAWIFMIIWWILIIAGIVFLVKWIAGQGKGGSSSALDILKQRYARGEISKEQFEEMRKDLG